MDVRHGDKGWVDFHGQEITDPLVLERWRREGLATVHARERLLVELARQATRIRRGLGKMTRADVDRELKAMVEIASRPWARHVRCETCGAVAIQLRSEGAFAAMVTEHPGGLQCRAPMARTPEGPLAAAQP